VGTNDRAMIGSTTPPALAPTALASLLSAVPDTVAGAGPAQVHQTHCAVVVLVGDRALKVKKPLDLTFVDFSDPARREAACRREVELNSRFAPGVYLGVAEVRGPDGEPCDWIVVMRRMPADRRLATLVRHGEPVEADLRALARRLAAHHADAARSARIDRAGSARALRERWRGNLEGLRPVCGDVLPGAWLDETADRALRYVEGRRPLLARRVAAGRIRDGHGDLLADDIFCLPEGPVALDCLEFDDDLRALDGVDDAACLAMDLERLGAPELGERFMAWFVEFSGQSCPPSLIHHYIAYRAVMRAKVTGIRAGQGDRQAAARARRLVRIGLRHLRAAEPVLVLVGGLPGTGKSTVAAGLADALGAVLLRSDQLRTEIADQPPAGAGLGGAGLGGAGRAEWDAGRYAPGRRERVYRELVRRAEELLGLGESVVLDATWVSAADRALARRAAERSASLLCELRCVVPAPLAAHRIVARRGDLSEATPQVAARMAEVFAEWPQAHRIRTADAPDAVVRRALAHVHRTLRAGAPASGAPAAGTPGAPGAMTMVPEWR
jgi:aminoglycoside phosphotransferase family enzyme/predicted kinase